MSYFILSTTEPKNDLPAAECEALTSNAPAADGFAEAADISQVSRGAYLKLGARHIAKGDTVDSLVEQVAAARPECEGFRIDYYRLPGGPKIDSQSAILAAANSLPSYPILDNPRHRFVLIIRESGFWFGEIMAEPDMSWKKHEEKLYRTSSSLSPRMARALVNLIAKSGDTVLNPCCGTGSVLLECAAMGIASEGIDHNPRMVGMSKLNLAYFGYLNTASRADARTWDAHGDCLIADLPYNKNSHAPEENTRAILANAARQAGRAVFVAGEDLTRQLIDAGYRSVALYRIEKAGGFVRYIHVANRPPLAGEEWM